MARKKKAPRGWLHRMRGRALVALIRAPRILPYRARLSTVSWLTACLVAPLAGYRRRIRANLAHVRPDLPPRDVARLCRAVPANTGRMLMEMFSAEDLRAALAGTAPKGPGIAATDAARAVGRPIVFVSAHFGNFEAARLLMMARGHKVGALYRPVDDPLLDREFYGALTAISEPIFPRSRRGLAEMLRFLRAGNAVAILPDQYVHDGADLQFFGATARTSLAAAEMALKYDALMIPAYGIRRGSGFEVIIEAPIPPSDPARMMQQYNDGLEARVRADMDQWLWIHRRWKAPRQRARAAASIGP